MADVLTRKQRSYNMSQIRGKDTKPEIKLRKLLFLKGLRGYRLHSKLLGKPDIVYPKYKVAIFVDGCFWHRCPECFRKPETRKKFWTKKINDNVKRDRKTNIMLARKDWEVLRFWEHEIRKDVKKCYSVIRGELLRRGFSG